MERNSIASEHPAIVQCLRILFVVDSFYPFCSGVARRFDEIIQRLARENNKIRIFTGDERSKNWRSDDPYVQKNVSFVFFPSIQSDARIHNDVTVMTPNPLTVYKEVRNFNPHVVHLAEFTPASFMCSLVCKQFMSIPVVWSIHSDVSLYISHALANANILVKTLSLLGYSFIESLFSQYCSDILLTVSKDFAKRLQSRSAKWRFMPNKPYLIWKTGVDYDTFSPKWAPDSHKLKARNGERKFRNFITVGRISPEKNLQFLAEIVNQCPDIFLYVVGDGHARKEVEPLFPANRVSFLGNLTGKDLSIAYASADFFISASESETFGQVYLEAMSSGLPVIASGTPQIKEFMDDGVHGWLYQPGSLSSAIEAVARAQHKNPAGKLARTAAMKHSWDSAAQQTVQLYEKAMFKPQLYSRARKSTLQVIQNFVVDCVCFVRRGSILMIWLFVLIASIIISGVIFASMPAI